MGGLCESELNTSNDTSNMDASNNKSSEMNNEQLPSGWVKKFHVDGRIYYQNNITKQTQWNKPTVEQLPYGWIMRVHHDGREYYKNTITKTTQWNKPTIPNAEQLPYGWSPRIQTQCQKSIQQKADYNNHNQVPFGWTKIIHDDGRISYNQNIVTPISTFSIPTPVTITPKTKTKII
eukprot:2303_1